jgi:centrosomal protein CEP135
MDNGIVEQRYRALCNHLDDLGYQYPLSVESASLVEKLVSDLLHTTDRLRHYKELAQKSLEESRNAQLEVESYKLDNARLVQECKDLHSKLLYQQDGTDNNRTDLRLRVRKLESENSDLKFLNSQHLTRINVLEQECAQKTFEIIQLQGKGAHTIISPPGRKKSTFPRRSEGMFELDSTLEPWESRQERYNSLSAQARSPYAVNTMELADQQISDLNQEINFLKEENIQQLDAVTTVKDKIDDQDKEIQRLRDMLEGGRPISTVGKHCSCKDMAQQLNTLSNEIEVIKHEKKELEKQVQESVSSQHEATTQAVMLADRNKLLEKELRDIDQMALAAEAEYKSNLEEKTTRVSKLQVQIENNLKQIHGLEQEVLALKRSNQERHRNMEHTRNETQQPRMKLGGALHERNNLDRVNELTIIEHDLNQEIERLIKETTLQKRRIIELELKLASRVSDLKRDDNFHESSSSPEIGVTHSSQQYEALAEKLKSERDFYYSEYCRLKEERGVTASCTNCTELRYKLGGKEQELLELRQANRELMEKEILRSLPRRETRSSAAFRTSSPSTVFSPSITWQTEDRRRKIH